MSSDGDLETFRQQAFAAEKPLVIKGSHSGHSGGSSNSSSSSSGSSLLPAATRWFDDSGRLSAQVRDHFAMVPFPYELMLPPRHNDSGQPIDDFVAWLRLQKNGQEMGPGLAALLSGHIAMNGGGLGEAPKLLRFEAPLALLLAAVDFNQNQRKVPLTQLYIAQASLDNLPAGMKDDVPPPPLVRAAGRGDVYASSLWLGLEPTYTPWHRDPNPNLFVQLCSRKTVRVMPPRAGERVFCGVQTELLKIKRSDAHAHTSLSSSSSRIRGEEMMQGPERELLHAAIWGPAATSTEATLQEASLEPGDMLFIPKGWWHSVKSAFEDGRLNGSVNWWFR